MYNQQWKNDEIEFLKKNYKNRGPKWCSEKLDRTYGAIQCYASQQLKLKAPQYIKYPINQDYFDIINHENTYILGFLCADGNLNNRNNNYGLEIPLSRKDKSILKYIRYKISPTRPIYDYQVYNKKYKKYYDCSKLCIHGLNQNFATRIQELGIFPRKTGKEYIPDISKKYLWSWMLGLFDGDGSIYNSGKHSYTFDIASGSEQFLLQLKQTFFQNYHCYIYNDKGNSWKLRIYKQESIKEIAQKLYKDETFSLLRKKQRFVDWGLLI
jgi:DNA-binding transcriptional regulator WhiA